jgi:hypothetical protein
VPILPLIDLLLLLGSGSILVGFALKAIAITTHFRPMILGFTSIDFVIISGVCLGFALTLSARAWVKINEHKLLTVRHDALRREAEELDAEARQAAVLPLRGDGPLAVRAGKAGDGPLAVRSVAADAPVVAGAADGGDAPAAPGADPAGERG